jgi:hypothetical protein
MDPVTAAIVGGLTKLSEPAIKDAYNGLKALLIKKFGGKDDLTKAVTELEAKPESVGRRETLREEVVISGADKDPELLEFARILTEMVKSQPAGQHFIQQTVTGDHNVTAGRDITGR